MIGKVGSIFVSIFLLSSCLGRKTKPTIMDLGGADAVDTSKIWLTHEHILVDFIGADRIDPGSWNRDSVRHTMLPFLQEIARYGVDYFVDATPNYLGRDMALLKEMSTSTGIRIITNTGFYGAVGNKYIPAFVYDLSAEELADLWIDEFENGIDQTGIKPGFMKIGVDNSDPLEALDQKLVAAAAITHLATGLTIASHTGKAEGMWPQLEILRRAGVSPSAFIWVHAQAEPDNSNLLKAAKTGCWISLDGLGWETENHLEKLLFARANNFLDRILLSHDAGWYDPQKDVQEIQPYTTLFEKVIPALYDSGFTVRDVDMLIKYNPASAFGIAVRKVQ